MGRRWRKAARHDIEQSCSAGTWTSNLAVLSALRHSDVRSAGEWALLMIGPWPYLKLARPLSYEFGQCGNLRPSESKSDEARWLRRCSFSSGWFFCRSHFIARCICMTLYPSFGFISRMAF